MLEDGSDEIDNVNEGDRFPEDRGDVMPEENVEPPDSQEFENMLDEAAEGFADEDVSFDNRSLRYTYAFVPFIWNKLKDK